MQIQEKDYVIAQIAGKKLLMRTLELDGQMLVGRHRDRKDQDVELEVPVADVLVNLGRTPATGSVYGLYVEPQRRKMDHEFWGTVKIFQRLDSKDLKEFGDHLDSIADRLLDKNLPQPESMILEVRKPKGKYAGWFKYRGSKDDNPDVMCAMPQPDFAGIDYIMAHEYAHLLWSHYLTPKRRLSWIRTYQQYVKLERVEETQLSEILDDIIAHEGYRNYLKEATEETKLLCKHIVKHLRDVHNITVGHLELMLSLQDDVSEFWPTHIEFSEKALFVSDYARKSPEELFSECFAHWFIGNKLPKTAQKQLTLSLNSLHSKNEE